MKRKGIVAGHSHVTDPLTDKQRDVLYGSKIERLTVKEILEKYGEVLTEEQKIALKKINN